MRTRLGMMVVTVSPNRTRAPTMTCNGAVGVEWTTQAPGIAPASITGPINQNFRQSTFSRTDSVWKTALTAASTLMISTPATGPTIRLSTGAPMSPSPMPDTRCRHAPARATTAMTSNAHVERSMAGNVTSRARAARRGRGSS